MTKTDQIKKLLDRQGFPVLELSLFTPDIEAVIFDQARDISEALNNWRILRASLDVKFNETLEQMRGA